MSSIVERCVGNGGLVSCALNIVAKGRWVIRLMTSAHYCWGESSCCPFNRRPSGLRAHLDALRKRINLLQLLGIEPWFFWHLSVIILTELSHLCIWRFVAFDQRSHATSFFKHDLFIKNKCIKIWKQTQCYNFEVRHPHCVGSMTKNFCVLHVQLNRTIFHLVVQ